MVEQLKTQHRCLAIKLPGHGDAPVAIDVQPPSIETELGIIEGVVREMVGSDQPIHLVGHSYGGVVALAQALKGSLPIAELTLFEPVATWVLKVTQDDLMQAEVDRFLARYRNAAANGERYACGQVIDFWGGGSEFEKLPGFIQDAMAPMTTENLRHWDICTEPQHSADDLRGMNVPTRVVCGRRSNAVAHAIADHLVETLPTARKFEVDDASHAMVTSHAQASLDILLTPVV